VIADPIPADVNTRMGKYPAVLRQLLYNRHIADEITADQYLNCEGSLYDPFLMTDMEIAVERLAKALANLEPIAVYGDYDVDGVTATALMVQVLRNLRGMVIEYIPNRFDEGYGLNNEALDYLAHMGVKLVVTVDCGIRSPNEAEHARKLGLDLIISDHHEPKVELPAALAVICPKRAGDRYPEKNLAGVGLAYKIVEALLTKVQHDGIEAEHWLDLVAVGTVADLVPMVGENRSLVKAGLELLRQWRRQGLFSLANVASLDVEKISARDIGFVLGPRLNAAGRLESAQDAFHLLVSEDINDIGSLAQKLDNHNRDRQKLTQELQEKALSDFGIDGSASLLFAAGADFKMGVVGLVASRLTEMFYRPSIVGAKGDSYTRASCRSIPEFNITHALDECAELLERYGGHALAAGFTVRNENLPQLEASLRAIADRELGCCDLQPVVKADLELPLIELKPEILRFIDQLEPTGLGNSEVQFVSRNLRVIRPKQVGTTGQHLRFSVSDGRITYDAIAFRQGHWAGTLTEQAQADLLYTYERNKFNNRETLQLNVKDIKLSELV
jgi:single-stranded-DNA-specific exonuclease